MIVVIDGGAPSSPAVASAKEGSFFGEAKKEQKQTEDATLITTDAAEQFIKKFIPDLAKQQTKLKPGTWPFQQ
jgi:hypothetical protein